jgi:cellulose synthase/poly-beta-1,6-N-acetylglucosamine synthase-like glycosyltransferase
MISVIVPTRDSAAALSVCLSALVPAAVSGLVKEVILADAGSTDATAGIAADAGAAVVVGDVAAAVATAKGDWLLILLPTTRLEPGWEGETGHHINRFTGKSACFRLAVDGGGPMARLREWLAALGAPTPAHGLLVERARFGAPGAPRRLGARAFVA